MENEVSRKGEQDAKDKAPTEGTQPSTPTKTVLKVSGAFGEEMTLEESKNILRSSAEADSSVIQTEMRDEDADERKSAILGREGMPAKFAVSPV